MNKKILSLILCLALAVSLIMPGITVKAAENEDSSATSGLNINKTAVANEDGSYTITLEAYATGSKVITEVKEDVPTDIILVLDQSGSMSNRMGVVKYNAYQKSNWTSITNDAHYARRHNGGSANLWYSLEDGKYASVSVTLETGPATYKETTQYRNNNNYQSYTNLYSNRDNLYAKVEDKYQKVSVVRDGDYGNRVYTYSLPNGYVIATSTGDYTSPSFKGIDGLYLVESIDTTQN